MIYRSHTPANSRTRGRSRRRLGSAVVEFAVVAPFIVVATMGMIEMTRGMQVKHVLSDAARSACRLAIYPGIDSNTIKANVQGILDENGIKGTDATVTIKINGTVADAKTGKQNDKMSVQVSIPVSKVGWVTPIFLPGSKVESETMVMMRQR